MDPGGIRGHIFNSKFYLWNLRRGLKWVRGGCAAG